MHCRTLDCFDAGFRKSGSDERALSRRLNSELYLPEAINDKVCEVLLEMLTENPDFVTFNTHLCVRWVKFGNFRKTPEVKSQ